MMAKLPKDWKKALAAQKPKKSRNKEIKCAAQ